MEIKEVTAAYFSPTGSTGRIVRAVAQDLAGCARGGQTKGDELREIDLSVRDCRAAPCGFRPGEVLVAGAPVYAGRIPDAASRRFDRLDGGGAAAVAVVVYGNRHYDDALLEMVNLLRGRGFRVIAAAAFVAEHSIVRSIAAGRPDESDLRAMERFAELTAHKLALVAPSDIEAASEGLSVPGCEPYRPYGKLPFHPHAGRRCVRCGLCARQCPVGAIPESDPKRTDKELCITCMRCVAVCPYHARGLARPAAFMARRSLKDKCRARREPEMFL